MLTDTQIRNARKAGKLTDAKGLYIEVRPTGAKLWRYRYKLKDNQTGKPVEYLYAMGEYCKAPDVEAPAQTAQRMAAGQYTLEEARVERVRLRGIVKQGNHPIDERNERKALNRDARANTFESVAREWINRRAIKWSESRTGRITRFLENDVFPEIGHLAIRGVSAAHLLAIVERVEARAPHVAYLLRQCCGAIFRFAMSKLLVDGDPTTALMGAIDRPATNHHKPLTTAQIPAFLKKLESEESKGAQALALLLLTFTRPTELCAAAWTEFDLNGALWTIPAERTKGKREHLVPLSRQAVALLFKLHKTTGDGAYLFPNYRDSKKPMAQATLNKILGRLGYAGKFTSHGFRATASTQLNELGYRSDVIEAQLAHKDGDQTRHSYNRAQYMPERKQMMQQWADHVDTLCAGANVTPIRKGKAA